MFSDNLIELRNYMSGEEIKTCPLRLLRPGQTKTENILIGEDVNE